MYQLNYKTAIHPDCGKEVKIHKDIIITPFYTEEFCDQLVKLAQYYDDKFSAYIVYTKEKSNNPINSKPNNTTSVFIETPITANSGVTKKTAAPKREANLDANKNLQTL